MEEAGPDTSVPSDPPQEEPRQRAPTPPREDPPSYKLATLADTDMCVMDPVGDVPAVLTVEKPKKRVTTPTDDFKLREESDFPRRRVLLTQQSTIWTRKAQAVCVRRAVKRYGTKTSPLTILNELNMTVPRGKIYGLLGASGCGKTTLLSCIVGRKRLQGGEIWVLGGKPGSRGSGVPGPRIGYMPQEIALYGEFTIQETLTYFGWISGMSTDQVREKQEFLIKLLMLPTPTRHVKNLSGGQQRRVSFAAAMLHDPELLILDEPTVGLDPVLRQSIWDHLVKLTQDGNKTVIITTHYIEETRQAGMIGLLRGGRFLAEDSPENLMQQYNCETLEDVFLKLSVMQNMNKRRRSSFMQELIGVNEGPDIADPSGEEGSEISGEFGDAVSEDRVTVGVTQPEPAPIPPEEDEEVPLMERIKFLQGNHMKALIWKNFLWMWRNVGVMLFIAGLPILQCIIFCLAIGKDPQGLKFAVLNEEINGTACPEHLPHSATEMLGCRFLKELQKQDIGLLYQDDEEEGKELVRRGKAWGYMHISQNFTESLNKRIDQGRNADDYSVEFSNINLWMDSSDQQILHLLSRDVLMAFISFAQDVASIAGYPRNVAVPPIRINEPVYGDREPNFTDFAAPGVILTVVFFLSVASTSGAIMTERNGGLMERTLVLGISGTEVLFGQVVTQFVVMVVQTLSVLIVTFAIFGITNRGDTVMIFCLVLLTGVCGMAFGFCVSCSVDTERSATYLSLGSFLPLIILCGIVWPVEGMHFSLQFLSMFLPLTKSTESLRSIMQKGWTLSRPTVYLGFVSTTVWIGLFMTASILALKFKKG